MFKAGQFTRNIFCRHCSNFTVSKSSKVHFSTSKMNTKSHSHTLKISGFSKGEVAEFILRLDIKDRHMLFTVLEEFQSREQKEKYEDKLAATKWRSKFGRPAKIPETENIHSTNAYCPLPNESQHVEYSEDTASQPTTKDLIDIAIANSIPFIGFGFLDNFFMLFFGDYIDWYLGSTLCFSTMAAAALGNTMSDVLGIGTAFYVERLANKIGFRPPKLSPIQLDMASSRKAANGGRVLGVTIGCILGMFPLLFKKPKSNDATTDQE